MRMDGLADRWRAEAAAYRARGLETEATFLESVARDLEVEVSRYELEPLSIADAAAESGFSESALYSMMSDGRLENLGTRGAPRIRRCDLPRKPGHGAQPILRVARDEEAPTQRRAVGE